MIKKSSSYLERSDLCHLFILRILTIIILEKQWMYNVYMLLEKNSEKTRVFESKRNLIGLIYGITCGISFAFFAWGIDAFLLAGANARFFWIKFLPGLILSALAGGLAGWFTTHFGKHSLALVVWGLLAILFTGLTIWLPTSGTEFLQKLLSPDLTSLLKFSEIDSVTHFWIFGLFITGIASIICGLLEINLVDSILLSSYTSTLVTTMVTCVVIFGLAGSASDYLVNVHFREPVLALNRMIQTIENYEGENIPSDLARELHLSAISHLEINMQTPRELTLISFDRTLGNMNILVNFQGTQVKCTMIYSQAANCTLVNVLQ